MTKLILTSWNNEAKGGQTSVCSKRSFALLGSFLSHYRAWNEAEFRRNIHNAGKKSLLQKWREFLAIMEFGFMLKPKPSQYEQQQKIAMLHRYYNQIHRFEARRGAHGKSV